MLYGLLITLFVVNCFLLILLVLVQQGKGNMGLGNLGGATQMIFGGSGGQDIFQKITWTLGTIFMVASLVLSLMKASSYTAVSFARAKAPMQQSMPVMPIETTEE